MSVKAAFKQYRRPLEMCNGHCILLVLPWKQAAKNTSFDSSTSNFPYTINA